MTGQRIPRAAPTLRVVVDGSQRSRRWAFRCDLCRRERSFAPAGVPGGVTRDEASALGWGDVTIGGKTWTLCPDCGTEKPSREGAAS
jgi:hypothetical protein